MAAPERGTKRKRPEPSRQEDLGVKFAGKLHHESKDVRKASKKAINFEIQRVVKRLKGLRKKNGQDAEIIVFEKEIEELKALNPDGPAHTALRTRLLKDKHITSKDFTGEAISRELPDDKCLPSRESKTYNRLLSNKSLAAAVTTAVTHLRDVVLPKKEIAVEEAEGNDDEEANEEADGEDVGDNAEAIDDDSEDGGGWESGSIDGDGWESGTVHSENSDEEAPPLKKTKATAAPKATVPSTTSQFLPSLSVGFIRGDSDSDVDDGAEVAPERKNRRGQRARRAIWEKKYGRGANHKKKEAEDAANEFKARVERRAARAAKEAERQAQLAQSADRGWAGRIKPGSATAKSSEPSLHPSWAAKRAQKEKGGSGGIMPSQGKKIVFD
ncbi:unnamed protein product [Mycena citricolor]|uniref:Bud22 domain-containing protein n=1 Tax=Mycena citricolor TaxID=2018698 RepID=A0AAD2H7Q2_9AGAR|nr:unnamed protein product [Mycena citricolor]